MTRVLRFCVVLGIAVVLAGCNVNTRFEIAVRPDGSGTVRTSITLDADAVQRMGGAAALAQNVPLGDLRSAGWKISTWKPGAGGTQTITLTRAFTDAADLERRIVDIAGKQGILQNPKLTHDRGWFRSEDALSVVVDVRSPSVDIVHDTTLSNRLRVAGVDPALLQAQIASQLKTALHVSVVLRLPGGETKTYDAAPASVETVKVAGGGTDWDHVVKFGIGLAFALLAGLFFLAAGIGARRNRRRAAQRVITKNHSERAPLM